MLFGIFYSAKIIVFYIVKNHFIYVPQENMIHHLIYLLQLELAVLQFQPALSGVSSQRSRLQSPSPGASDDAKVLQHSIHLFRSPCWPEGAAFLAAMNLLHRYQQSTEGNTGEENAGFHPASIIPNSILF